MFPVCTLYPIYLIYLQYIQYILYIQYIQYILSLDHMSWAFWHISRAEFLPPTVCRDFLCRVVLNV